MVKAPNESDEELRSRHVTGAVASEDQELGSREDLINSILSQMQLFGLLHEEDAPQAAV